MDMVYFFLIMKTNKCSWQNVLDNTENVKKNFLSSEHLEVVTVHIFMYIFKKKFFSYSISSLALPLTPLSFSISLYMNCLHIM